MSLSIFEAQLPFTLASTNFSSLGTRYVGKVRDTYASDNRLILVTTDRLSAFDRVLTTLPFKGDMLSTLAHFWFKKTEHIAKNHVVELVDPAVLIAHRTQPLAVEVVVRGALTGSLWRDYQAGNDAHHIALPPGLRKDSLFERPLITPSTKAPVGLHDEPMADADVVKRGIADTKRWSEVKEKALALFAEGQRHAASRGLILVDTKYEFGLFKDTLLVIDEMHTPDSSRYWVKSEYAQRFAQGVPQKMLDKENLRQWLLEEKNFSGHGEAPSIPDSFRCTLAASYLEAWEWIVGQPMSLKAGSTEARLRHNLSAAGLL